MGPWTKEEDEKLKQLVNGQTNIAAVKWRSVRPAGNVRKVLQTLARSAMAAS